MVSTILGGSSNPNHFPKLSSKLTIPHNSISTQNTGTAPKSPCHGPSEQDSAEIILSVTKACENAVSRRGCLFWLRVLGFWAISGLAPLLWACAKAEYHGNWELVMEGGSAYLMVAGKGQGQDIILN